MRGMGFMAVVAACALAGACAGSKTTDTYPKRREISSSSSTEVVPDSQQLVLQESRLEGTSLSVAVQQAELCRTTKVTLYATERGEESDDPMVTEALCHHATVAEHEITLRSEITSWTARGKTDASGRVLFELSSLGEPEFSRPQLVLTALGPREISKVKLSIEDTRSLRAKLEQEPASQLAKDRWVSLTPRCKEVIDMLRSEASKRDGNRTAAAEEALLRGPAICKGASNEGELRKLYGSPALRNMEREIRISLTSRLNAAFGTNDAIAIVEMLQSPMAMEIVATNGNTKSLISNVTSHWIAMLLNNIDSTDRAAQLCAARKLYVHFVGLGGWEMIRADLSMKYAESDYLRGDLVGFVDEQRCVL